MTYEEYKKQKQNNVNSSLSKNATPIVPTTSRYEQYKNSRILESTQSPTQTSVTPKQSAFNILNNATSSQNYDSLVQTKENTNNSTVTLKGPMQALDAIKGGNKFERTLAERQNKRNAGLMVEEAPLFTPIGLAEAGSNPIELVEAHRQAEKELSNINQKQKEAGNYEKYMGDEYSKLGEYQNNLNDSIREKNINQMAKDMVALKNAEAGKEVQDLSKYYDSGATQANYILGNLNIRYNEAMAKYLKTQNLSDLNEAERIKELITLYNENAQNVGEGGLIRKDFASYAPQLVGQTVSGVKGAIAGAGAGALTGAGIGSVVPGAGTAAGASTGALWGARAGYVAGVGSFSYDQMQGSAYAQLLDLGIPDDIAKEVASDTALWQSVVEMTGAVVDLASLGLGSKAVKGAAGKTVGQLTAKQLITNALKAYGINLVEETAEEAVQEKIAIEQEKKAFEKAGLERTTTEKEDQERIVEAGAGGFKIALVSGSGNVIGNITATTINNSTISKVNKTYDEQINKIKTSNLSEEQKQEQINTLETGRKKTVDAIKNAMTETEGKKIIKVNNLQENVTPQSPNTQIQQQTNEVIPQETENQQNANMVQNNTQIAQNTPNNVQISQNNVQNAQDLQKTEQLPLHIQTFVDNRAITSPGLNVIADETLTSDGMIEKRADGTRTIKINPNSKRAYEFIVVHEMMHDLEGTQEFQELYKYVKNRAISHNEFESAKKAITEQYTKYYTENNLDMSGLNMDVETTNDMVARALGNQEFLNELAGQKPNVFMRIYNWIKNVAFDGNNTGKTFSQRRANNKYLQELKNKFETAYNAAYKGNNGQQFDIITTQDNKQYAKATRQVIKGNDVSKWGEQVEKYINEEIRKGQDVSFYGADGELLTITRDTAGKAKFRNEVTMADGTKRKLTDDEYKAKLEAETHIDELAQISKHKNGPVADTKNHSFAKDGFNYRTAYFEDSDGKYYKITMSVGKNGEINTIYNVGQMKDAQKNRSNTSNRGLKGPSDKIANGSTTSTDIISLNNQTVKNSTQSSFSLGENTLPKVQKGYTRLYRGLTQEYDANYDKNKIDNSNGYESWTDNYELAKAYGDNVYYIDVPTSLIKDSIIDEDDKSETYGDRNLIYRNDKSVGIKGKSGNEYMLYTDHDDFTNIQYNKVPTLTDIQEKNYSQSNNEWQKYLDKNWNLMPNTTKTFGLPNAEQLQARDLKQGEEISNTLNMKKQEDGLKEAIDNISKNDKANEVSYTTDLYRNMRNALGEKAGRELTGMFDNQKLAYVKFKQKFANELKSYVVDKLGIRLGSEMSADVQRFGEKIITEAELKEKYPNNWQNIVEADKWFRAKYNELIDAINATREDIYPNVEEQIKETKESLLKTYDLIKEAEKTGIAPYKIDQDIQDNVKRLEERIESKKEKIKEIEDANSPNYRKTKKYNSLVEQLQQLEQNKNELERTLGTRYDEKVARLKKRAQRLSDTLNSEELWRGKRIPKRDNYYRHFQEMAEGFKALHNIFETPAEISSQLAGTSEYTKPNAKFLGLAQKRTTNETEYDAVKGFLNYLEPASYAVNIDPFTVNLRAITKTIKDNTTDSKNANKLIEYLDDFTNSLAGKTNPFDRLPQKLTSRKTMKAIEWLGNRIKSNAVLGNINSSISQILNLPQVVGKIKNPVKLAQGVYDLATGKGKYQDSQFIQERYHSDIESQFKTKLLQQPKKFATWMLGALDEAVTKTGWNAVYRQAIEKGIDNPIQYADDTMRDLVAGRGIGERSLAQESKLVNLVMPFTVETGNYWRVMKDFVKEKDFGGILITYIVGWLLNRGIEALGASGKTFDPIDAIYDAITEEDISIVERVGRVGGEVLSSMPFGQQLAAIYPEYGADLGVFKLPGREDLFGSNDPTRFGTGSMFTNIFEHPVTSLAMPWGGTQLRRTLEGAEALLKGGDYKTNSKGEEQLKFPVDLSELEPNEKMLKAIQVLTLGKYATPEAQNYFDNGALSAVQTKGLKEAQKLGISSKEFYEIRDKIKAIKVPTRKNKEGKDEAIPGARKKLIIEELNKTDLNSEQKKLFYDIFYSQELK